MRTIELAPEKRLKLGEKIAGIGSYGWVYRGELQHGNHKKPVAVKRFRPYAKLTERRVAHFRRAIEKLRNWGADIPEVEFHKVNDEWVQVMELFPRIKSYEEANLKDDRIRRKLMRQIAATANAGYYPNGDAIGLITTSNGPRFIIYDFDAFADCERLNSKPHQHKESYTAAIHAIAKAAQMHPAEVAAELKQRLSHLPAIDVVREIEEKSRGKTQ